MSDVTYTKLNNGLNLAIRNGQLSQGLTKLHNNARNQKKKGVVVPQIKQWARLGQAVSMPPSIDIA